MTSSSWYALFFNGFWNSIVITDVYCQIKFWKINRPPNTNRMRTFRAFVRLLRPVLSDLLSSLTVFWKKKCQNWYLLSKWPDVHSELRCAIQVFFESVLKTVGFKRSLVQNGTKIQAVRARTHPHMKDHWTCLASLILDWVFYFFIYFISVRDSLSPE